jgi:hypothetical protein
VRKAVSKRPLARPKKVYVDIRKSSGAICCENERWAELDQNRV